MTDTYTWVDNPTESGKATCDTDILNSCLMHLKYDNKKGSGFPLLSSMWSDHLLNDVSWLRADTWSWQSGDVYKTVYDKLVEEYATGTEETEGSITFKRTTNGFKIATGSYESAILSKYNTDGIAWYYILDTTNKKFKLPRMKYKYWKDANTLPVKGNGLSLGFSNGDANYGVANLSSGWGFTGLTGAYGVTTGTTAATNAPQSYKAIGLTLDSSKSGIVTDVSNAVEETGFYLYFYVGEYSQTAIEQTAGITSEQLNGKVDVNLSNFPKPYLKTTYVNGTSGYNIWSNGYCEQWGITTTKNDTITLLKTYSNTDFSISATYGNLDSASASNTAYAQCGVASSSTIWVRARYATTSYDGEKVYWKTLGYLAEGEY